MKKLTVELAEEIACVAHTANRIYCNSIGDFSQVPWELAPDWQKQSAVLGVQGVLLDGRGPEASHENWYDHKIKEGWTLGEVKDFDKKTHPCLMPYSDLSEEQKGKDKLFVAIVGLIADHLDVEEAP